MKRLAPLVLLLLAAVALLWARPDALLSMAELAAHHAEIEAWIARHYGLAVMIFAAIYFATKTFFIPTGPFITSAAGFLLGTAAATAASTVAGLLAASVLYLAADLGVGRKLRNRSIPFVDRLAGGFRRYGFLYLVSLRLLPVAPFWAGCLVPAILGVPFRTYLVATLLGSFPSQLLYASLGGAIGKLVEQGATSADIFRAPTVLAPLFALAALSLAPILFSRWRETRL